MEQEKKEAARAAQEQRRLREQALMQGLPPAGTATEYKKIKERNLETLGTPTAHSQDTTSGLQVSLPHTESPNIQLTPTVSLPNKEIPVTLKFSFGDYTSSISVSARDASRNDDSISIILDASVSIAPPVMYPIYVTFGGRTVKALYLGGSHKMFGMNAIFFTIPTEESLSIVEESCADIPV